MTLSALQAQTSQSLTTLLAKLKAEQEKDQASGSDKSLQSLGAQIVKSLTTSGNPGQSGAADSGSSNPLAELLSAATPDERAALAQFLGLGSTSGSSTQTGSANPSLTSLSALLAKTQPGPAGDQARAAIVASLTASQASGSASNGYDATPTLFSFLS